jgi:hypothetical protein
LAIGAVVRNGRVRAGADDGLERAVLRTTLAEQLLETPSQGDFSHPHANFRGQRCQRSRSDLASLGYRRHLIVIFHSAECLNGTSIKEQAWIDPFTLTQIRSTH